MQISVWEKETFLSHKDVIIVGSGFAGLWTARELKKKDPSLKICLVDRGSIPTGASTRNAGFSCFGSLTELVADAAIMGEEKMLQLVKMRYDGLKKIGKTFNKEIIDYKGYGGYELFASEGIYPLDHLEQDCRRINKLLKPILNEEKVFRQADKKIKKFGFRGISRLIENELEGQLHPGKLTRALLRELQKKDVEFLFGLEVTGIENKGKKVEVQTNQQIRLSANQLIICTNAFTKNLLPGVEVNPARGQILVTSEIPGLKIKGTFHYEEGFYYFRNLGKRILLGGARNRFLEEENTTEFNTSNNIQAELERFLRSIILPDQEDFHIDYRWSGIMGMGKEKTPEIRQLQPNVFCALAMGGIGVAVAPIVAEKIARMVLNKNKKG